MKKSIIAIICLALSFSLVVPALAEETDYSYLQDMSVKELKELRAAIDKLLPPEEEEVDSKTEEVVTDFPEEDDNGFKLDVEEEHYKAAIDACNRLIHDLKDPDSFELVDARYEEQDDNTNRIDLIVMATNTFGGRVKKLVTYYYTDNWEYKFDYEMDNDYFEKNSGLCYLNSDYILANIG